MSNAKQSKLQKFKIPNPNIKKTTYKIKKKIAFDIFSSNTKPFYHHHPHFGLPLLLIFLFYHCISYIILYIIMLLKFV